jgi:hypothetical protein
MWSLVPHGRVTLCSSLRAEVIEYNLSGTGKIRLASGRAYWVFKMKSGSLLLEHAAYVNPYRPLTRIRLQRLAGGGAVDIVFLCPGPILLLTVCMPLIIGVGLNHEWGTLPGALSLTVLFHFAFSSLFAFERRRVLRDIEELSLPTRPGESDLAHPRR